MSGCRAPGAIVPTTKGGVPCRPTVAPQVHRLGRERPRRPRAKASPRELGSLTPQSAVSVGWQSEPRSFSGKLRCRIHGRSPVHAEAARAVETDRRSTAGRISTTRLGDWYGNVLRIRRRQLLLFISERSRLPVILPIQAAKHLPDVFPDAVCERLATVGAPLADIAAERLRMREMAFGRTRSRSLLGTMNDFSFMA